MAIRPIFNFFHSRIKFAVCDKLGMIQQLREINYKTYRSNQSFTPEFLISLTSFFKFNSFLTSFLMQIIEKSRYTKIMNCTIVISDHLESTWKCYISQLK